VAWGPKKLDRSELASARHMDSWHIELSS